MMIGAQISWSNKEVGDECRMDYSYETLLRRSAPQSEYALRLARSRREEAARIDVPRRLLLICENY